MALVSREARLTFAGLWTCSDDYGVTKGHPAWLKAQVFPYDVDLPVAEFQKWLADMERIGVIAPFTADGESFFFIRNFADHQKVDRPSKMRNPPCPRDILAGPSRVSRELLATDSRECSDETETETETETEIQTTTAAAEDDRPPLKEGEQGDDADLPTPETGRRQPKPAARVSSPARKGIAFDYDAEAFGHYDLTEITPAMISDYNVQRRGEGVSPRTINYELTVMSHVFTIAMTEWQLAVDNPVKRVRKERLSNKLERWLTPEEEAKLLKASPHWIQDIIVFAINTGMRQSEILDLKWGQIDMDRRTLTISEQKNRSVDTLPLNGNTMKILAERYREGVNLDRYVFPNGCRHRIVASNLMRAYRQAVEEAGIAKIRFHDLRHTFASRLVQNGADLFAVQKLGRWKNTSMVMRYAHHYTESLRATIEMMDGGKKQIITNLSQSPKRRISTPRLRLVSG